jgi:hypothetical protein
MPRNLRCIFFGVLLVASTIICGFQIRQYNSAEKQCHRFLEVDRLCSIPAGYFFNIETNAGVGPGAVLFDFGLCSPEPVFVFDHGLSRYSTFAPKN